MNDINTRFNTIVSLALKTSDFSRATHEAHYNMSYKYGMVNACAKPTCVTEEQMLGKGIAYVDPNQNEKDNKFRLVLDMNFDDRDLISAMHHELVHVNQVALSMQYGFPLAGSETKLVDAMAQTLIWEAQASTGEVEGPLFRFFDDLDKGKTENIDFYKKHFETNHLQYDMHNYVCSLLQMDPNKNGKMNFVDAAGHYYMNGFSRMDETEKSEAKRQARMKTISGYWENPLDSKRNMRLFHYTSQCIINAFQMETKKLDVAEQNRNKYFNKTYFAPTRDLPLRDILKTTYIEEAAFLSEKDWHEVLDADSNLQFTNRLLYGGPLWEKYEDALKMGL